MEWHFSSDLPIYSQLVRQLSEAIVSGRLSPGSRIPAVRDLALDAGVNPNTVQRALTEMERDGLVFSQRTSGRYVTDNPALVESTRRSMARELAEEFINSMNRLGCSREETISLLKELEEVSNEHT